MAEDTVTDGQLERIQLLSGKPGENSELIRAISAKLLLKATSQDGCIRQSTLEKLWSKNSANLVIMASLLETTRELPTCINLAALIREAVCLKPVKVVRKSAQKKASLSDIHIDSSEDCMRNIAIKATKQTQSSVDLTSKESATKKGSNSPRLQAVCNMVKQNSTSIVIRSLLQIHSRREPNNAHVESLLYDTLWILSQLALKDSKFALKLRTYGGVKIVHNLLRIHFTNNKVVFPLLSLMKQLTKSTCTVAILVRDDVITTYEKVLMSLGHAPTIRLRLCLDALDYLSRNKACCALIVKAGIIILLLRVFDRWEKYESKIRIKICTRILQTLQHVCTIKVGRRTLATKKHIQILYRFCTTCPDEDIYDRLITKVSSVICHSLNNRSVPVPSKNPATFDLSNIISEWPLMEPDDDLDFLGSSSDDEPHEEDEILLQRSDSEAECAENPVKISDETLSSLNNSFLFQSSERDIEDLKRYNQFFKEFLTLQMQLRLTKGGSKENLLDSASNPRSLSDFSINRTKYAFSMKSAMGSSTPGLLFDVKTQIHQFNPDLKLKKTDSIGNLQCNLKILEDLASFASVEEVYLNIASRVRSIIPFVKVAFPDLQGGDSLGIPEFQHDVDRSTYRKKVLGTIERAINPETLINEVVYSLDSLTAQEPPTLTDRLLTNTDSQRVSFKSFPSKRLEFESRFESGNLRKAVQIGPREYDLILMPDVNSKKRHLWFYFEVSNMANCGGAYTFNVVNCEKPDSQFNFGMKPVMYSVKESIMGRPGWLRVGSDICYYRNSYPCHKSKILLNCFHTVTFTIDFPHSNDVCYIAYHYPYTYTQMMTKIWIWSQNLPRGIYFRLDALCNTLNNNEIPLVTITSEDSSSNPIHSREIIFLTARVHPGESNASWVMDGALGSLLNESTLSKKLRSSYVFKIIPMLNVEGVINGCYRCGLTNEDLNRRWSKPSPVLHPGIFHTKGLLEYMNHCLRKPASVYCDFHGHSRKKNVFLYGCSNKESWCKTDRDKASDDEKYKFMDLPVLMHRFCSSFSLASCSFRVEREREATARVTVWRQLRVPRSYTLEASFCGFDQGPYKGLQVNTQHLQKVGHDLCASLDALTEDIPADLRLLIEQGGGKYEDSEGSSGESPLSDSDEDFI